VLRCASGDALSLISSSDGFNSHHRTQFFSEAVSSRCDPVIRRCSWLNAPNGGFDSRQRIPVSNNLLEILPRDGVAGLHACLKYRRSWFDSRSLDHTVRNERRNHCVFGRKRIPFEPRFHGYGLSRKASRFDLCTLEETWGLP
jgi:hypothetical protein